MTLDLFAGIRVRDLAAARGWYERLLGAEPSFLPNDVEAVWELAEHRYLYLQQGPQAGRSLHTVFLEDAGALDARVHAISEAGIEPALDETYDNGVRKVTYHDPDGNELGFGGPSETAE